LRLAARNNPADDPISATANKPLFSLRVLGDR
jgi:hypothetical protein